MAEHAYIVHDISLAIAITCVILLLCLPKLMLRQEDGSTDVLLAYLQAGICNLFLKTTMMNALLDRVQAVRHPPDAQCVIIKILSFQVVEPPSRHMSLPSAV